MKAKTATKSNDVLISIGIPTYNRPDELRRTLQAIINQTYRTLEIIVSDNASTHEGVEKVVREFMRDDPRIQYIRQSQNIGALANFQFVLEQATGDYFMWAADDDFRAPTFIAVLVEQLISCPECAISFCDFYEIGENGIKAEGYPRHLPLLKLFTSNSKLIRLTQYFFQLESKGKANMIYGLMKRDFLRSFQWGQFIEKYGDYGADMLFVFTMLNKGRLVVSDQCLYQCTVGNKKEYGVSSPLSLADKIALLFTELAVQLRYSAQYVRIASGWVRLIMIMCWPLKSMDIIIRIFLFTELNNFIKRVKRFSHKWQTGK